MTLARHARTAVQTVAKFVAAESLETGTGSSCHHLTVAGRRIAIETITIEARTAGSTAVGKRGLRFDRVARRLLATLQAGLDGVVCEGTAVAWTVTAPIRLPAKSAAAIETRIKSMLASRNGPVDYGGEICGNQVRVRLIKGLSKRQPRIIGFVHNAGSRAHALLNLTQSLLQHVVHAKGERWLVIVDADGAADLDAYRYVASQLSMADHFKKILVVCGGRQVEEVAKPGCGL